MNIFTLNMLLDKFYRSNDFLPSFPFVTGDPEIVRDLHDITASLNVRVVLSCEFINIEHFSWWRDEQEIPLTLDTEVYTIQVMEPPVQGYYYCIGMTESGEAIGTHRALVKIRGNFMRVLFFIYINSL